MRRTRSGNINGFAKSPRRGAVQSLIGVAITAGIIAAGIGALVLSDALDVTGLPDPGPATSYGLPFVRAVGQVSAVVAIGNFLFAAFLVPPQSNGVLDADGYRALRLGGVACAVWATCAALLVALTLSDVSGVPLRDLSPLDVWSAAGLVEITSAWRMTAVVAALVAAATVPVLRWSWAPALLAGALLTLVPLAVTGHSSSGGAHDIATNSLLIHLFAAALWAGGLLALLSHALRRGSHTDVAARRFSAIALWCFVALATSGVVNAVVRLTPPDIVGTGYGRLVLMKALALCGLGVLGWRQRRTAVVALQSNPSSRGPLLRIALTEAALLAATFGVAVGLSRTPPPAAPTEPSPAEVAIGFNLPESPTLIHVLTNWRFDLIFGTAAIVLAVSYFAGVCRLRRQGDSWQRRRTTSWVLGCIVLLFATSSGLGSYMSALFSAHMLVQLVMTMLIPILLVLGSPVTLALKALRPSTDNAIPGPREWLLAALRSPWSRFLTFPVTAFLLFTASGYGLYYTGAFDAAVADHATHVLMLGYWLLSGTLFFWVVAGVEQSALPASATVRMATGSAGLAQFVWIGIMLRNSQTVLGESFYRSLRLEWHTELLADQRLGGAILSVGAACTVLVVAALVFSTRSTTQAR